MTVCGEKPVSGLVSIPLNFRRPELEAASEHRTIHFQIAGNPAMAGLHLDAGSFNPDVFQHPVKNASTPDTKRGCGNGPLLPHSLFVTDELFGLHNIGSLKSFRTLSYLKFYFFPLLQGAKPVSFNG